MAVNKNALIRYKTIDQCLRNTLKKWTLNDLLVACSDALYEFEGKHSDVSKRTLQLDIQLMRSDKLGYNAPIEVYERKYYRYADPDYSITKLPLKKDDVHLIKEAVAVLKQFKDFSLFSDIQGMIHRIEGSVLGAEDAGKTIIHFDKNEHLKGLAHINTCYQAIKEERVLTIVYQSFKASEAYSRILHPQFLKEYNNRWFLFALEKHRLITLALDRIQEIQLCTSEPYRDAALDPDRYFKNVVGATVHNRRPIRIQFKADAKMSPYIATKPFHSTQRLLHTDETGSIFNIFVIPNFELERLFLGYANHLEILKPERFRQRIAEQLKQAAALYS